MKRLLAVLSAAFLIVFLLGSCSSEDASVTSTTSTTSTKPPANRSEGSASKPEGEEAAAPETQSVEAKTDEVTKDEADTGGANAEKPDIEGVEQKNVRLLIDDQTTAGQVIVKQVSTSRNGWVSIHQSREDGSIGLPESIGEARVDAGESKDVIVDLWEAPAVGDKLWVLLHIDAGEQGAYEFPDKDLPVKKNGDLMARSFTIENEKKKKDDAE